MQKRHFDRNQYFGEQDYTTRIYVIPFIEKFRPVTAGTTVLEIGCGEGGNLKPFLDLGCQVTGIDLSEHKIKLAHAFFEDHPHKSNIRLICEDIYNQRMDGKYDILIMRDVIEHIHDQSRFIHFIRPFMHSSSLFFIAFPPWQNPFGGHQQICRNKFPGKIPWIHLLPAGIYSKLLHAAGESEGTIANLLEVKETGISIERFEKTVKSSDFHILSKIYFLINPNYEIKFRLKPVLQCRLIAGIPVVRNFITTSVFYLLSPSNER